MFRKKTTALTTALESKPLKPFFEVLSRETDEASPTIQQLVVCRRLFHPFSLSLSQFPVIAGGRRRWWWWRCCWCCWWWLNWRCIQPVHDFSYFWSEQQWILTSSTSTYPVKLLRSRTLYVLLRLLCSALHKLLRVCVCRVGRLTGHCCRDDY